MSDKVELSDSFKEKAAKMKEVKAKENCPWEYCKYPRICNTECIHQIQ